MTDDERSLVQQSEISTEGARRLWFDYLVKLNDRRLQRAAASGATNWVLLALATVILYRAFPQLPYFLSSQKLLRATAITFLLQADVVVFGGALYSLILEYFKGYEERRLLTDVGRRIDNFNSCVAVSIILAIGMSNPIAALSTSAPRIVRLGLFVFGTGCLLTVLAFAVLAMKRWRQARRLGLSIPRFGSTGRNALAGAAISIPVVVAPVWLLGTYLRSLGSQSESFLALSAATHLIVLFGTLIVLLERGLSSAAMTGYETLERAIVLENLAPSEIASRFIRQLCGEKSTEWLVTLRQSCRGAREKLESTVKTVSERATTIAAAPPPERRQEAQNLLSEFDAARQEYLSTQRRMSFTVREIPRHDLTSAEADAIIAIYKDATSPQLTKAVLELRERLVLLIR